MSPDEECDDLAMSVSCERKKGERKGEGLSVRRERRREEKRERAIQVTH